MSETNAKRMSNGKNGAYVAKDGAGASEGLTLTACAGEGEATVSKMPRSAAAPTVLEALRHNAAKSSLALFSSFKFDYAPINRSPTRIYSANSFYSRSFCFPLNLLPKLSTSVNRFH